MGLMYHWEKYENKFRRITILSRVLLWTILLTRYPQKFDQFLAIFSIGEYYKWNTSQLYDIWKTLITNYRQITQTTKLYTFHMGTFSRCIVHWCFWDKVIECGAENKYCPMALSSVNSCLFQGQ